jgi:hypothetical protein
MFQFTNISSEGAAPELQNRFFRKSGHSQPIPLAELLKKCFASGTMSERRSKIHWLTVTLSNVAVLRRLLLCAATTSP